MACLYLTIDRDQPELTRDGTFVSRTLGEARQSFRHVTRTYWPTFIVVKMEFQPTHDELAQLMRGQWPARIGSQSVQCLYRVTSRGALLEVPLPEDKPKVREAHEYVRATPL